MNMYSRNRLYISRDEQKLIKGYKILLAGAGIGSVIAECALRIGFESITIIDGDKVEESNLNRQNYTNNDIGQYKAETLAKRLLGINPNANISYKNVFITHDNIDEIINCDEYNVAINALDFNNDIPFAFDESCKSKGIYVLHPYDFGWAGFVTVYAPDGTPLSELSPDSHGFELKMAKYVVGYEAFWMHPKDWLESVVKKYAAEKGEQPAPKLSVASWLTAGLCTNILYNLATNKPVKTFPKFYISSLD